MSNTARYALAFVAAASVGAFLGALLLDLFWGPVVGACAALVLVALADPRVRAILSGTYNMYLPFSSGAGRRGNRDD